MNIKELYKHKKLVKGYFTNLEPEFHFHDILFDKKSNPIEKLFGRESNIYVRIENPSSCGFSEEIELPFDLTIPLYQNSEMNDSYTIKVNSNGQTNKISIIKFTQYKTILIFPIYYYKRKKITLNNEENNNKNLENKIKQENYKDLSQVIENISLFNPKLGKLIK